MNTLARILNIAWKELLHLRKDRILIPFFMLGALAELTMVAWSTGQPIDDISMTVVDLDGTVASAALIERLDETDELTLDERVNSEADIKDKMGKVNTILGQKSTAIGIIIPEGYGEAVKAGERPEVRIILNGAQSVASFTARRKAEEIIFQQGMREAYHLEPEAYADDLPQVTVKYNEELNRSWYTLPAETGLMFYMMTIAIAALGISREREKGTFEQLQVMPFRPIEVILGKALTPMGVGYMLFLSMLFLTVQAFGVPLRGSLLLLLMLAVLYLLSEMGKGVLASMISKTQLQAFLLVFTVAMVDMIFSGYAVAVETMPPLMQKIAYFIPIRHWLIIERGIMLKDVGLDVLWPNVLTLVALGSVIIAITATQYRRHVA